MWVYIETENGVYTVGHWAPIGKWEEDQKVHWNVDSDHATKENAAARVHYLNGGKNQK